VSDGPRLTPAWRSLAIAAGIAVAAAAIAVSPPKRASTTVLTSGAPARGAPGSKGGPARGGTRAPVAAPGVPPAVPGLACAPGSNGGATDVGVTAGAIKLGATVVDSGIGASFLRDARFGMVAVKDAINRAGGICGRKLELVLVDDGWESLQGGDYIRDLVEDKKVFALAVVPSSEGLKNVSDSGYLRRKGVPVVGSDGMLIHQYDDPYIWPVAASTVSAMHVMAKQAFDAGARHFGIVYESTYHFGLEGAYAFNAAVKRLTGHDIDGYSDPLKNQKCEGRFCGIAAGRPSYSTEIDTFNSSCLTQPRCDFVALLLEPATAISWLTGGALGPGEQVRMGGPQPLFTRNFAQQCGTKCNGLWLWTGYDPPVGANASKAAVSQYLDAVKATNSSADFTNTFVEGAYVGMRMLVEALARVGPDLTRARLIGVLDSMTFDSGLSAPLTWRPGNHFANVRLQAWSIQFKDRFSGWRDEQTQLVDPWVGQDVPR
jgi:branched-chain amino acid transport system substrate-binding protein